MAKGRVLVTGRYGFTGQYVARALASAGWQVWGGCSRPTKEMGPFDRVADLTDHTSVTEMINDVRPDAVVHLAGIAFVGHGSVDDFYNVNLLGTRNLLDTLSKGGHGKSGVVLASSANVYGNSRESLISENTLVAPANDYAVSKLAMEYAARLFANQLPIAITRPFNYTGVGQGQQFLVPKIVAHFRDRAPKLELGNMDVARDFLDVRDVAAVYAALLDGRPISGETVNNCSGRAIALGDIISMCRAITGHDIEITVKPAFVRTNEVKCLLGDPSRVTTLLEGVERHNFDETLKWMLGK
jgi:nucleoside-diphosphate-sugar epimerase